MLKIESSEENRWLEQAINWNNTSRPLKVSNFLPDFDNYFGVIWKVEIIENFPFQDFIENAKTQNEIQNNKRIWYNFPKIFEDSELGFTEIPTKKLFEKFNIPYHHYKNDRKLPWNTRAIKVLESKIRESLAKILSQIPENKNLIMYWEDNYRFNIDGQLFKVSKEEYLDRIEQTGFDATMYLYPESKNWCLVNLEDLGFNILAFNDNIKQQINFLDEIESFEMSEHDSLFE